MLKTKWISFPAVTSEGLRVGVSDDGCMPCRYSMLYKTLERWTHANSKFFHSGCSSFSSFAKHTVPGNNFVTWMRNHIWYHFLRKWLVWISTQKWPLRSPTHRGCCSFSFGQDPVSEIPELGFLLYLISFSQIFCQGTTWIFDPTCFMSHQHCHNIYRVPAICEHLGTR